MTRTGPCCGAGELRLRTGNHIKRYFIEAGFAQVRANNVTVLTAKAVKAVLTVAANANAQELEKAGYVALPEGFKAKVLDAVNAIS